MLCQDKMRRNLALQFQKQLYYKNGYYDYTWDSKISPDEKFVATCQSGSFLNIYNMQDLNTIQDQFRLYSYSTHKGTYYKKCKKVDFSFDSTLIVACIEDKVYCHVYFRNSNERYQLQNTIDLSIQSDIQFVKISLDNKYVYIVYSDDQLVKYNIINNSQVYNKNIDNVDSSSYVRVSLDDKFIYFQESEDENIVIKYESNNTVYKIINAYGEDFSILKYLKLSPDNQYIGGTASDQLHIWQVNNSENLKYTIDGQSENSHGSFDFATDSSKIVIIRNYGKQGSIYNLKENSNLIQNYNFINTSDSSDFDTRNIQISFKGNYIVAVDEKRGAFITKTNFEEIDINCPNQCITCLSAVNCLTCVSNFDDYNRYGLSQNCQCKIGFFQNNDDLECVECDNKCLECDSTGCTSCKYTDSLGINRNNDPSCDCKIGYFQNSQNLCQKCNDECQNCNSLDICIECKDPFLLNDQQCICPIGKYKNENTCSECNIKCKSCNNPNTCQECADGSNNRKTIEYDCICKQFYYQSENNLVCSACESPCLECQSLIECISCDSGYYLQENTCIECHEKCQKCNNNKNQCIQCTLVINSNRRGLSENCECEIGFYENNNPVCQQCDPQCKSCTVSSNNCTVCINTQNRILDDNTCNCLPGYYEITGNQCIKCPIQCQTCNGDGTCILCSNSGINRNAPPLCECIDQYFQKANDEVCQSCLYPCQNCSSATQCTSCINLDNRIISGTNICDCMSTYYDDGTQCQLKSCTGNYKCSTCSSGNSICDSCSDVNRQPVTADDQTCNCKENFYDVNGDPKCHSCIKPCLTCISTSDCLTCDSTTGHYYDYANFKCICNLGYYNNINNVCEMCNYKCQTCVNGTTCQTCKTQTLTNQTTHRQETDCGCIAGRFDDGTEICKSCFYPCITCETTNTTCTGVCFNLDNRKPAPSCECNENYYSQSNTCQRIPCNFKCNTCLLATLNICLTCALNSFRSEQNNCSCLQGYYEISNQPICQQCIPPCLYCESQQNCISCVNNINRNYNSSNKKCECEDGYFENNSKLCIKCNKICSKCYQNANNCTVCKIGHNDTRQNEIQNCICKPGFFESGELICSQCEYPCLTCENNKNECLQCYSIPNRNMDNNLCQCERGYYDDGQECQNCDTSCFTCNGQEIDKCTQCDQTQQRIFQLVGDHDGFCICKPGFFNIQGQQQCELCQYPCKICISLTECTQCAYNLQTNRQDAPFCHCISNYYYNIENSEINDDGECLKCHQKCQECDPINGLCTICQYSAELNNRYNDINEQCNCLPGYYEDGETFKFKDEIILIPQQEMTEEELKYQELEGTVQTTETAVQTTVGVSVALLVFNPAAFVQLLDTLQMIYYTMYLNVPFPDLINTYFEYFEPFSFSFLTNIVPINSNFQQSRPGIAKLDISSFLLENISQYILVSLISLIIYILLQILSNINKIFGKSQKFQHFLDQVIFSFEGKILLSGILASYLATCIPIFMQITYIGLQNYTQIVSHIFAYFLLIFEISVPVFIFILAQKKPQEKYNLLFELFQSDQVLTKGFFGFICVRKMYFAFVLVVLNNSPFASQIFLMIQNVYMIIFLIVLDPLKHKFHKYRDIFTEFCYFLVYFATMKFNNKFSFFTSEYNVSVFIMVTNTIILAIEVLGALIELYQSIKETIQSVVQKCSKKPQILRQKSINRIQILPIKKEDDKSTQQGQVSQQSF